MRAVVAISLVLYACGPDTAVEIVVEMDPQNVAKVQLYVGLGDWRNETGQAELLVPSEYYPEKPGGFYWKRDLNGARDVLDVDPGATDVRFVFHEGSHDRMTVIVIGYDAGGAIVAATTLENAYLDSGTVRQYHVKLKPASAAFPRPTRAPVSVHRWGSELQCARYEDATKPGGVYVVEHDDRDCDGFVVDADPVKNLECRPEVFNSKVRPSMEQTDCVLLDKLPTPTENTVCVLGGPGCVDGRGRQDCTASTVCTQPGYCIACDDSSDPLDCMMKLPEVTAATHIECAFFVEGAVVTPTLCPGPARLSPLAYGPGCDASQPIWLWSSAADKWSPTLVANQLTVTPEKPTASCGLSLHASGTPTNSTTASVRSILSVPLANGRGAALPLVIKFPGTTDCAQTMNFCRVLGEDLSPSFLACLGSAVQPW